MYVISNTRHDAVPHFTEGKWKLKGPGPGDSAGKYGAEIGSQVCPQSPHPSVAPSEETIRGMEDRALSGPGVQMTWFPRPAVRNYYKRGGLMCICCISQITQTGALSQPRAVAG